MHTVVPLALVEGVDDRVWLVVGSGLFLLVLLAIVLSVRARRAGRSATPAATTPDWDAAATPPPEAGAEEVATWSDPLPEPATAPPEPATAPSEPEPAAAQPASSDVHYCRCPSCQTQFSVNGPRPIVTNCPGCGKKGYLR